MENNNLTDTNGAPSAMDEDGELNQDYNDECINSFVDEFDVENGEDLLW